MALAASGQISISQINTELGRTSTTTNTSLRQCSNGTNGTINTANATADRPNTTAPHSMSEFYSYNHTLSSVTLFLAAGPSRSSNCGNEMGTKYYHNGSGELPTTGDSIFTNSAGTTAASNGYYLTSTLGGVIIEEGAEVTGTFGCRK
tara:strand:+ start:252 stop:695 length:444 start_codon:yes stop_codon:yes gene_type:complete